MKFAKEIENDAVPEWRAKYLDYRQGKKKIKAIVRAERSANNPLKTPRLRRASSSRPNESPSRTPFISASQRSTGRLHQPTRYGSIVGSPPSTDSLNLPEPAITRSQSRTEAPAEEVEDVHIAPAHHTAPASGRQRSGTDRSDNAFEVGKTNHPHTSPTKRRFRRKINDPPLLKSLFGRSKIDPHYGDLSLEDWKAVQDRKDDFFEFLDAELHKINDFYEETEAKVAARISKLRDQLHRLRDQREQRAQSRNEDHGHFHQQFTAARRDYNSEAFRKINKKFDKSTQAKPAMAYYKSKVINAPFMQNAIVKDQIQEVEDLYARYFERGNLKSARIRLEKTRRVPHASPSACFLNGILFSIGTISGINAILLAVPRLFPERYEDPGDDQQARQLATQTSYLLQLYGGYFLMNLLLLLFCLACKLFKECKINYPLIFEFDFRSTLDWTRLITLPLAAFALQGVVMWLNFTNMWDEHVTYEYWPVVLIAITFGALFLPLPILYYKSRRWFLKSMARLWLGAGILPVEFRDFFLGDMFCSLTYAMGNIELFFCLYARNWNDEAQCNSSHSRLLGFFTALPAVWRLLQCLRRVYNSKGQYQFLNSLNAGKYTFTIASQATLSVYRISRSNVSLIAFIVVSVINSFYVIGWDIFMDWSLLDSRHGYLRAGLGYPKQKWMYYTAMVIDPILRFQWIPYAALRDDIQHSAITSFVIAIAEILRRSMWLIFRIENEHCTNVRLFKAQAERALPYSIDDEEAVNAMSPGQVAVGTPATLASSKSSIRRIGTFVSTTHAQDFVRKRASFVQHDSDDDDDDDEDTEVEPDNGNHVQSTGKQQSTESEAAEY